MAGNNITYTQTATNNGPLDGLNAVLTEPIPANTTFQSIVITGAGAAGWSCSTLGADCLHESRRSCRRIGSG